MRLAQGTLGGAHVGVGVGVSSGHRGQFGAQLQDGGREDALRQGVQRLAGQLPGFGPAAEADQALGEVAGQEGAQGTGQPDPVGQRDSFPRRLDRLLVPAEEFQYVGNVHVGAQRGEVRADTSGQGQAGPEVVKAGVVRAQVAPGRAERDRCLGLLLDRTDLACRLHRPVGQAHRGIHVVRAPDGRGQ